MTPDPTPTTPDPSGAPTVAAWVDGVAVAAAEVDSEVARLRSGPAAARLPRDGTADGRQLRRWVTQRVVLRVLLDRECATRALTPTPDDPSSLRATDVIPFRCSTAAPAGPTAERSPSSTARGPVPAHEVAPDPSVLGTAAADVLAVSATARAVLADVVRDTAVPEADVRAAYDRARPTRPERWLVRQSFSRRPPPPALPEHPIPFDPATLLPEVRAALPTGAPAGRPTAPTAGTAAAPEPTLVRSSLGWHLVAVDAVIPPGPVPYEEVRDRLAADLTDRARQTAFARWLDAQVSTRVRLAPGFEHPADPANPDATHRH